MKKISGYLMFVICFAISSCTSRYKPILDSAQGVHFKTTSFANAIEMAKTENKPLFLFAHASWCPTCKKMEQEVLVRPELGQVFNQKFVNVAIDIDSPDGKALQKLYPIKATPTLFLLRPGW